MTSANTPAACGPGDVVAGSPVRRRRVVGARARRSRPWTWWTWCLVVGAFVAAFPLLMILFFPGGSCDPAHASEPNVGARLRQLRDAIQAWETRFGAYPPSRLAAGAAEGPEATPFRVQPPNAINEGIEALYLALDRADLLPPEAEFCTTNTDADALAGPEPSQPLLEFCDPWGHPLVYFVAADYADALRDPPTYVTDVGDAVAALPRRDAARAVRRPTSYQLFSMGADGQPNTDDDVSLEDDGSVSGGPSMRGGCGG